MEKNNYVADQDKENDPPKKYTCSICSREFSFASALSRHKVIHKDNSKLKCVTCKKPFSRLDALKRHIKDGSCKPIKEDIKCDGCGLRFAYQSYNMRHTCKVRNDNVIKVKLPERSRKSIKKDVPCTVIDHPKYELGRWIDLALCAEIIPSSETPLSSLPTMVVAEDFRRLMEDVTPIDFMVEVS